MKAAFDRMFYRLAPGVVPVLVGEDGLVLRSDSVLVRIDGAAARLFAKVVIPLLDGRRSLADVLTQSPDLPGEALHQHLDELTNAGAFVCESSASGAVGTTSSQGPLLGLLQGLGISPAHAKQKLANTTVGVFGLGASGAYVAELLAQCGVGELSLIDPYPARVGDQLFGAAVGAERLRQAIVKDAILIRHPSQNVTVWPHRVIDRDGVASAARQMTFLVSCFDRDFAVGHQWVNRAALQWKTPALFGRLEGSTAIAGPLVLPDQTGCYMCWRMRVLACADDFAEAMGYEELLDKRREQAAEREPSLPPAAALLGGLLANEFLKTVLAVGTPGLAGKVMVSDLLQATFDTHQLLQRPDCPACHKKKLELAQPPLEQLSPGSGGDVLREAGRLVSAHCGVIRSLGRITKDQSEPERPYIYRAELANSRFRTSKEDAFVVSSGKGMTVAEAMQSALGEAVERYAGSLWDDRSLLRAQRKTLEGPSLDPQRLVLYRAEQYAALPYTPYTDELSIGWTTARSLCTGQELFVPSLAVFMAYEVQNGEGFICPITSNGLAAGATLPDAVLAAALEVIERDAFLACWLHKLPTTAVDPLTHPQQDVVELCRSYERRRVRMELYRVPMDHPVHVFISLGVDEDKDGGPTVVVGLGASLDPAKAARSALLEVAQVRPALRLRLRDPETQKRMNALLEDNSRVKDLEDHDLLYCSPKKLGGFDFLRSRPRTAIDWSGSRFEGAIAKLEFMQGVLRELDSDLIYRNVTTDDMARLGLHAARVIIPDFQPIYFGEGERRLGGERLYTVPRRLGLRPDNASPNELNRDPHPLA